MTTPLPSRLRESAKVLRALHGVVTVFTRIAGELTEAADALEAGPWMPIETAPKDKALLTHDGVSYNLAHFNTALGKWIANHPYDERLPREPIRWTLLPPHPRSGTAAQVAQEGADWIAIGTVRIHRTCGNAGVAWSVESNGVMPREGETVYVKNTHGVPASEYLAKIEADPRRAAALQRARERAAGVREGGNG